jgi:hypothetical protein
MVDFVSVVRDHPLVPPRRTAAAITAAGCLLAACTSTAAGRPEQRSATVSQSTSGAATLPVACVIPESVIHGPLMASPTPGLSFKPEHGKSPSPGVQDCLWSSAQFDTVRGVSVEVQIAPLSLSKVSPDQGMVQARYAACTDPEKAVGGVLPLSFICGFTSRNAASYTGAMVGAHSVVYVYYFCEQPNPPDEAWSVRVIKALQAALISYA